MWKDAYLMEELSNILAFINIHGSNNTDNNNQKSNCWTFDCEYVGIENWFKMLSS